MRVSARTGSALLFVASALAGGCGPVVVAATPREALRNVAEALETGEKARLLDSVYVSEVNRFWVSTAFDMTLAARRFSVAAEKAWGDQAKSAPLVSMFQFGRKEIERAEIIEKGDAAVAKGPRGQAVELLKRNGAWLLDMSRSEPKNAGHRDAAIRRLWAYTRAFDQARARVGRPGWTREKILRELAGAIEEAAYGKRPAGPKKP